MRRSSYATAHRILTMFSGAGEVIDPDPHATLASCESELVRMQAAVETEWAVHGILRTAGECREYDPASWGLVAGSRAGGVRHLAAVVD